MPANAITQTYGEVENLIHREVWRYHRATGVPVDELESNAAVAFCVAYKGFDPNRGQFSTHLVNTIRFHFLNEAKKIRKSVPATADVNLDNVGTDSPFDLNRFTSELSEDARSMIMLLKEAPEDLAKVLKTPEGFARKMSFLQWVAERFSSWHMGRIAATFNEIKGALV
jgi:DNA-directed RNA polymerase specialized sigma24 family protein